MNRLQSVQRANRWFETTDYAQLMNGLQYAMPSAGTSTLGGKIEDIDRDFGSLAQRAYMSDSVVFAVMLARMMLFTEARFRFQEMPDGQPGDYFGNRGARSLDVLDHPWPGGTTGDLLKYMISDHDLAGNAFVARTGSRDRLLRLRPDWTTMIHGSDDPDATMWDPGVELLGYGYQPGGPTMGRPPIFFDATEVAHFSTIPDPFAPLRGMSWLTPLIREIMGDQAMTEHRLQFFEHGATPSLIVKTTFTDVAKAREWIKLFRQDHEGTANAYKAMFLSAGSDATVVGGTLQQVDFKAVQGAGETRIAAAGGVPPVVAGLSEGLQGSSLNAGNFAASMRRFADLTVRPLWRNVSGSLERIVPPPENARLWYDDRDIPALKDDVTDAATVQATNAAAISSLITSGYEPESVVVAVTSGDLTRLKHSGLYSVQLQPPMPDGAPAPVIPPPEPARYSELIVASESRMFQAMRSMRTEPPVITVNTPDIHVTTPDIRFENGAIHTEVHPQRPADVQVINAESLDMDSTEFAGAVARQLRDVFDRPVVREVERDENGRPLRIIERRIEA